MGNLANNNLINSCINIESKRISRRHNIPENISFNLDRDVLSQIKSLKKSKQKIFLSGDNLAELRYYFLLNSSPRSGLGITFQSYYYRQEEKIVIIKSIINLSGKADQYIRSDALGSQEIISSHYWLIEQILTQIPLKFKKEKSKSFKILLKSIILLLSSVIAALVIYLINLFISVAFWANALLLLILAVIIFRQLSLLIKKYLYSWVLEQLLFGVLASSLIKKKIGLNLLEILHN